MGTGVGEAMLIGAVTGGGVSAVTGGDPLKGALLGAAGGGLGAGVGGALGGQAATAAVPGAKRSSWGNSWKRSFSDRTKVLFNRPYPPQHWAQPTWQLKRVKWPVPRQFLKSGSRS
jgi:hypothetical protein